MRERPEPPRIIGVAEYVDFPDWGVHALSARVDTGARSSALHVENLQLLAGSRVRFEVSCGATNRGRAPTVQTKVHGPLVVPAAANRSRIFVQAHLRLGGREQRTGRVVDRRHMLYACCSGEARRAIFFGDVTSVRAWTGVSRSLPRSKR